MELNNLAIQEHDLRDLDEVFSERGVWKVVQELSADRAPGPDGFIGLFYQKAWGVIRLDVMAAQSSIKLIFFLVAAQLPLGLLVHHV